MVWITGASSGIGEELAYCFARLGAKLVLSGTRLDALKEVSRRCTADGSPRVECVAFDVADHASHEKVHNDILDKFGETFLRTMEGKY